MKRGVLAILTLVLLSLAACGKEAEEPDLYGGIRYIPAFTKTDLEPSAIQDACLVGDAVYLTGRVETDRYEWENRLYRLPLEGGEAEELPGCETADQDDPNVTLSAQDSAYICPGPEDTLLVMERVGRWYYDFPEGFDPESGIRGDYYQSSDIRYILHRLDREGKELSRQEWPVKELEKLLGLEEADYTFISEMKADGDGDLYLRVVSGGTSGVLAVMDAQGALRCRLELEGNNYDWGNLVVLSDDRVGITCREQDVDGDASFLYVVNKWIGVWGDSFRLPGDYSYTVYDGCGDALFYYQLGNDLMAWREPEEEAGGTEAESARVLNWVNTGIDASYAMLLASFLPDGRLAVIENGSMKETGGQLELAMLTPAADPPEKTVLTFGTVGLTAEMEAVIREFNRTNPDYRVEVRDYIDYQQGYSDRDAAVTRLATEVGAGRMPDILDVRNMPVARWAANGLLEDLWPWIDRDSEIDREDLMERVFEAASIGGKLYEVGNSFCIQTVVGAQDVVGERMSWTPEEMWEALAAMPEGCDAMDSGSADMLCDMLRLNWDRFVDWEKGQCHFDSEEFRSLLEYCGRFPAERASGSRLSRVMDRQQMLLDTSIRSFEQLQEFRTFLGGQISFVGYPNDWGEAGSRFQLSEGCAMTSACRDKEGAWTFLRTLLLPRNRADTFRTAFSTNREDFQRLMEEAMKQREVGRVMDYGDVKIRYRPAKQADCDQIMALYNASEGIYRDDRALTDIIYDIAGACFAGDKSVEETMELIQNRAELYVSEQT